MLTGKPLDARLASVFLGCFFLACAASALNQAQEKDVDALMTRTAHRPVAAGRMSGLRAVFFTFFLAVPAFTACFHAGSFLLVGIAAGSLVLYNGVYTPFKRHTPFALLAGASVGAVPLLMGWIAAGKPLNSPLPVLLYGISFLWQIPHFWLRAQRHRSDYERAGFALPPLLFEQGRSHQLMGLWFHAFIAAILLIPALSLLRHRSLSIFLAGMCLCLVLLGLAFFQFLPHSKVYTAHSPLRKRYLFMRFFTQERVTFFLVDGIMGGCLSIMLLDILL